MELIWALRGLSLQSQNDNVERRRVGEIEMAKCKDVGSLFELGWHSEAPVKIAILAKRKAKQT